MITYIKRGGNELSEEHNEKNETNLNDETESLVQEEVAVNELNEETEKNEAEQVEEVTDAESETVQLQAQLDEAEERNLRLQAEIANMRRINTRERQDAAKYRSQKLATQLLDVVDNLERALAADVTSEEATALKKGVEMVYNQFLTAFEKEKITVLNPLNEPFDPNFHQAVSVMPRQEDQEADVVLNVLQKGYLLDDRILRPAMVIVSE